jgi:hypothetical protein
VKNASEDKEHDVIVKNFRCLWLDSNITVGDLYMGMKPQKM